jgi:transcription antitermination factor NusG
MSHDEDPTRREWFAVQAWIGRERATARQLRLRAYDVFLPCTRERRQWSDRVKVIERALFDGYIFCRLARDVFSKVVTTPGVIRLVGDRSGPLSIPAHEIDAIERIVESRLTAEACPSPCIGDRTRVEHGPLRGIEGVVLEVKNRQRLVVSIPLLQRAVAVEIDASWVSMPSAMFTG